MFFLGIVTKVTATRQQWHCRPEHHCMILFSFQRVHICMYMHMLGNKEVLYLLAKASSLSQLQLTYIRGKTDFCTFCYPGSVTPEDRIQYSFASRAKFVTVDSVCVSSTFQLYQHSGFSADLQMLAFL